MLYCCIPVCQAQNGDAAEAYASGNLLMAKDLELEGVKCAENGDLPRALELLTEAQKMSSDYASAYNNRAQVSSARILLGISYFLLCPSSFIVISSISDLLNP